MLLCRGLGIEDCTKGRTIENTRRHNDITRKNTYLIQGCLMGKLNNDAKNFSHYRGCKGSYSGKQVSI